MQRFFLADLSLQTPVIHFDSQISHFNPGHVLCEMKTLTRLMVHFVAICCLICLSASAPNNLDLKEDGQTDYGGHRVYRLHLASEKAAHWLMKFEDISGVEFWDEPVQEEGTSWTADLMVAPNIVPDVEDVFRKANFSFQVIIEDVQKLINAENPVDPLRPDLTRGNVHNMTWDRYHKLEDIESYISYLETTYSDLVSVTVIGTSTEGRSIEAVRFHTNGGRSDKKTIFIDGGIHAREWISPATVTFLMKELIENSKYDCILNQFDLVFVPVINVDGYAYTFTPNRLWRKTRSRPQWFRQSSADRSVRTADDFDLPDSLLDNLRNNPTAKVLNSCVGTDGNRNFDFKWGQAGGSRFPCVPFYSGTEPFSEPETRALSNYILENKDKIAMYITLHSYGQLWLLPWGYTRTKPDDYDDLYSLAKKGTDALKAVHGTSYRIGSTGRILYLASGNSVDWAKAVAGIKYAYTIELRDRLFGFLLPAGQIVPTGQETTAGIMAAVQELGSRTYSDYVRCNI